MFADQIKITKIVFKEHSPDSKKKIVKKTS